MIALLVAMMAARVEPHMIMATPKPYGNPDNSPLTSSNYPCKVTSDPATFYKTDGIIDQNSMVAGENQTLSFTVSNAPKINNAVSALVRGRSAAWLLWSPVFMPLEK